jgi:branched-chain amino acid transport system substrate-binding protein
LTVTWGATAIGLTGDVTLCSSFLKGYQTLSLTQPKYLLATCEDQSIYSTLGSELGGSYVETTSSSSAADVALYAAITRKYAPSVSGDPTTSSNQAAGLTPVLALLAIMAGGTSNVTPATIMALVKADKNVTLLLSGGITFTCNGTAIPLLPDVCSAAAYVGKISSKGVISDVKEFNPTPLFKM